MIAVEKERRWTVESLGVTELERTRLQGAHLGTLEKRTMAGDMVCTR